MILCLCAEIAILHRPSSFALYCLWVNLILLRNFFKHTKCVFFLGCLTIMSSLSIYQSIVKDIFFNQF